MYLEENKSTQRLHYLIIQNIKKNSQKHGRNTWSGGNNYKYSIHSYNIEKRGKYFSLKDNINNNCLVYKFMCPGDLDTQYIRETEQQLFVRIKEHITPTKSSVFRDIENCRYCQICINI